MMVVPQGEFALQRYPVRPNEQLRAWDAADEYLLNAIAGVTDVEMAPPEDGDSIVIFNDSFGALAVGLQNHQPSTVSDSQLALAGAAHNLAGNLAGNDQHGGEGSGLASEGRSMQSTEELAGPVDLVVLKVPKSLALLEEQLRQVRAAAHPGTRVIAGAMVRHVHRSTLEVFEDILGPTTTSLAVKKARLIVTAIDLDREVAASPWPKSFRLESGLEVVSYPGVFAAGKLDQGTRLLLDHLPTCGAGPHIVDLGCGNGVLGTALASTDTTVTFLDKSFLALASAEATFGGAHPEGQATFRAGDGADGVADQSIDVVVSNPPFHDDQALAEATAWKMFTDAHRILKPGGELRLVGNRHLGYHAKLAKIFGNRDTVGADKKFVVLSAQK